MLVSRALIEDQYATGERRRGEEEDGGGGDQSGQRETIQAHRGDGTLAHPSLRRLQAALQDSQRNTFVRSPIRSSLLVLALLAVPLLLLAGCGGGSGEDPQKVLQETFSSNKKVTSGKLDLTLSITTDGVQNYGYATDNAGWTKSDRPVVVWSPDSKKIATFQQDVAHSLGRFARLNALRLRIKVGGSKVQ